MPTLKTKPAAATTFFSSVSLTGDVTGFLCYGDTPLTDRTYDLYWIAADPRAHGTGAAQELLDAMEAILRQERARLILAETSSREEYARARRFYEKNGYRLESTISDFYADGDDRLIFVKRLPNNL